MNKNAILSVIVIIVLVCIVGITLFLTSGKNNDNTENNNTTNNVNNDTSDNENSNQTSNDNSDNNEDNNMTNGKVLVVYYSAQNHTKAVAEKIASNLNADTFEIVPKDKYTSSDLNWTDSDSRVTKEHNDTSLRDIELVSTSVPNWGVYDTVLIGYPIWWGIAAWPVDNFIKDNDFTGKTVIPFCTSSSSGLGESGNLLEKQANGGNWLEGTRFSSNASDASIKTFTDSIK